MFWHWLEVVVTGLGDSFEAILCQHPIPDPCQTITEPCKTMKMTIFWPCFDLCQGVDIGGGDIVSMPISAKHGFDTRWQPSQDHENMWNWLCGSHFRGSWRVSNGRWSDSMPNSANIDPQCKIDYPCRTQFRVKKRVFWHGNEWFSWCPMVDAHIFSTKWKS